MAPPLAGLRLRRSLLLPLLAAALLSRGAADEETHAYNNGEPVVVWLNKIGPYHNPQETYTYYTLPFCKPAGEFHTKKKYAGIGEILEGNDLVHSAMHMDFGVDRPKTKLCEQVLTLEDAETFKYAISQHYWYQLYLDDLPVWGMVGEIVGSEEELERMEAEDHEAEHDTHDAFIYTTKRFSVAYNGRQIIEVNLTAEDPVPAMSGQKLELTYAVSWHETSHPFDRRFDRYLDYSFFEHQIHWFSIFNSFMMVIFLCGLVSLILLRTLRNDYAKYTRDEEELPTAGGERGFGDDSGWKQVHGDVFRRPEGLTLFCALYGTGMQFVFLVLGVVMIAIVGTLYIDRGAMVNAVLVCYALTSAIAGYTSGSVYNQYYYPSPAPNWIRTMVVTALIFPICCFLVASGLNAIAVYYATINVIPVSTLLSIIAIWVLVALPLTVLGTILGRHWSGSSDFPCRVNALPRPIPEGRWHTKPWLIVPLTGVLPFGSIFIEMYFIFTSFWNYKFYYVYGFMLLVFVILCVVSVCVTIVAVYLLLNSEDYRWPWLSYMASSSTAVYVFLYSVYYFFFKTNMTGFLQTCFYFGYMWLFCVALALMCGTIGSAGSMLFVKRIYRSIKVD